VDRAIAAVDQRAPASAVAGAAALFWLVAYGLLTVRSMLDPASSGELVSAARLVATACGAGLLAGICILWDRSQTFSLLVRLRMLALAIGAAVAIMYGVRLLTAELFGQFGARESADALRWLIAWSGWFVAAVALWMARPGLLRASQAAAVPSATSVATPYEASDDPLAPDYSAMRQRSVSPAWNRTTRVPAASTESGTG
jgi:hypothetical protein